MTVTTVPGIVESLHAPRRRRLPIESTARNGALVQIHHIMVGDHHDAIGIEQASNAELIELLLRAHHHAVVNDDELGRRIDDLACPHAFKSAGAGEYFFGCRHAHCGCSPVPYSCMFRPECTSTRPAKCACYISPAG